MDRYERYWLIAVAITLAVFFSALVAGAVIYGVRLDDPTQIVNPAMVDQIGDFATLGPGVHVITREDGTTYKKIVILAQRWHFNAGGAELDENGKEIIHVTQGDEVQFVVASRDVTHGFLVQEHNINFELVPGQISSAKTIMNRPGQYAIVCHEYCGKEHQGMWMTIIVDPASESVSQNQE